VLGDTFGQCFRSKLVMVRHPLHFQDYRFGIYWDSWGTQIDTPLMLELLLAGPCADRWRTAPMGGEVSYNYGCPPGTSPDDTLTNHVAFVEDLVRRTHCNHLGWIADYDCENPEVRAGAARLQQAFGYRFVIDEAEYPARVEAGAEWRLSFCVRNTGSTPLYYKWPVEVSLLEPNTRRVVWQRTLPVDVRTWQPGTLWLWHSQQYARPAEAHRVEATLHLPPGLRAGDYLLTLALLDPAGNRPAVRFATKHYFTGGRHPLGLLGVGAEASRVELNEEEFDDPGCDGTLGYEVG
jgi:hypothetical protein